MYREGMASTRSVRGSTLGSANAFLFVAVFVIVFVVVKDPPLK